MSEITTLKWQREHKPQIEEVIPHLLSPDKARIALDFVDWLGENGVHFRWTSHNQFVSKLGTITIGKQRGVGIWELGNWVVMGFGISVADRFIGDKVIEEFVWKHVRLCNQCSTCNAKTHVYVGKEFDKCCGCFISNPDENEMELMKKLSLLQLEEKAKEKLMPKPPKPPVTEDSIIKLGKPSSAELQKFFKKALGTDYEKFAHDVYYKALWDNHMGKTLGQVVEELRKSK